MRLRREVFNINTDHLKIYLQNFLGRFYRRNFVNMFLFLSLLTACGKEGKISTNVVGAPIPPKLISSDTLTNGQLWGLTIGQQDSSLYLSIQAIRVVKQIDNLFIVGNVFTNLNDLENRIPLYTSLYLGENQNTANGLRISFADNKVNSMVFNNGMEVMNWPMNTGSQTNISIGEKIEDIYQKLVFIKNLSAYASIFEQLSLPSKDISKSYDIRMSLSHQWYFTVPVNDKCYHVIKLNLAAGRLVSIYSNVYEMP